MLLAFCLVLFVYRRGVRRNSVSVMAKKSILSLTTEATHSRDQIFRASHGNATAGLSYCSQVFEIGFGNKFP